MTDPAIPPAEASRPSDFPLSKAVILAVLAASLMVGAVATTSQSYWIEEAMSLVVGTAPRPAEAWKYANAVGTPALQSPVYHVYLFLWHKLFGGGEWAMRASNLPWFVLAQAAFLLVLRHRPKLAITACLLAAVSPVIWTYLDETRPYLMQYAAACWLTAAIARATWRSSGESNEPNAPFLAGACGLAILVLCGTGLSSIVWAGGSALALLWLAKAGPAGAGGILIRGHRAARWWIAALVAALALLAAYHVATWKGLPGTDSDLRLFVRGTFHVAYEFLGFAGFGPGKIELRVTPVSSVIRHLPTILPLVACIGAMAFYGLGHALRLPRNKAALGAWGLALGLPGIALLAAFLFLDQRPLPRDFVPLLPALMLALAAAVRAAFDHKSLVWRAAAIALPVFWLASSLNLRWQRVHAKDDYRAAAAIAAASLRESKEVWWSADSAAAYIYLGNIQLGNMPGRLWAMQGPEWNDLRFKFPPRLIVMSKPDIYDSRGAVARYAVENHFVPVMRLQAFTILARENDPPPGVPQ